MNDSGSPWGGEQRGFANFEPRVDLSMGTKIIEIPQKNKDFRWSQGLRDSAAPQNLSLGTTSEWEENH